MNSSKQLANLITITRIAGVALIFWLTPFFNNVTQLTVIYIYIVVCLTDWVDGWVARKFNIVTDVGKVLDPLADKLVVLVFLPLLSMQAIKAFPVFIILAREFSIMALRVVSAKNGVIVPAKLSGKIKTALTFPLCGLLLGRVPVESVLPLKWYFVPLDLLRKWVVGWPDFIIQGLIWVTVAITVWSFLDYFTDFLWGQNLKKANGNKEEARKSMLKLVPNFVTFLNFACGLLAVILAVADNVALASFMILLGIFFDALDGKVARFLGVYSEFGASFDTKADFISFGIAPGVLIYSFVSTSGLPFAVPIGIILGLCTYGAVHYRLRRFEASGHSDFFQGLPSPAGAAVIVLLIVSNHLDPKFSWVIAGTIIMCGLMVSKIPFAHLSYTAGTYLRFIARPALAVYFGCLFYLLLPMLIPQSIPLPEMMLGATMFYLLSPLTVRPKK